MAATSALIFRTLLTANGASACHRTNWKYCVFLLSAMPVHSCANLEAWLRLSSLSPTDQLVTWRVQVAVMMPQPKLMLQLVSRRLRRKLSCSTCQGAQRDLDTVRPAGLRDIIMTSWQISWCLASAVSAHSGCSANMTPAAYRRTDSRHLSDHRQHARSQACNGGGRRAG